MYVCCVFSLESPHRGDSNKYIQYTHFQYKKRKIALNYPKTAVMGIFAKGLKNEFETAVVNEPSVFESLKFYCMVFIVAPASGMARYRDPVFRPFMCFCVRLSINICDHLSVDLLHVFGSVTLKPCEVLSQNLVQV